MVRKTELEHLRLQRELLALQCDANRLMLSAEWEQLQSCDYWLTKAGKMAREHPLKAAALAAATGLLATQTLAKPAMEAGWLGWVSRGVSMAASAWKFFDGKSAGS